MTFASWPTEARQISERCWAYIQAGGPGLPNFNLSNSGLVLGNKAHMVIDSLQGPIPARTWFDKIASITNTPLRHLVNTHGHPDHWNGNSQFSALDSISATKALAQAKMISANFASQKVWAAEKGVAQGGEPREIVLPEIAMPAGMMTLWYGDLEIQLHTVDWAHSPGDIMVWVPSEKVLFAGDCCFFYVAPTFLTGTSAGSLRALDFIDKLGAKVIVPGHGPLGGAAELVLLRNYIETLRAKVRECFDAGMSVVDVAASIQMPDYDDWGEQDDRLFRNTLRIYMEYQGKPFAPVSLQESNEMAKAYHAKRGRK